MSNFYGHVMLGLRIYFLYFKSTQRVQNMFFYQFVHSSESISSVRENFTAFTLRVYTHISSKNSYDQRIFFKEKLDVISFQKHVGFSTRQLIFLFFFLSFFLLALPFLFSYLLSFFVLFLTFIIIIIIIIIIWFFGRCS